MKSIIKDEKILNEGLEKLLRKRIIWTGDLV